MDPVKLIIIACCAMSFSFEEDNITIHYITQGQLIINEVPIIMEKDSLTIPIQPYLEIQIL